MIEPCERPIMFELTQTADLSHWKGEASDPAWHAFLADARRFIEAKAEPKPAAAAASAPSGKQTAKRASIAVLPFVNRSGRSEDDIFADGMVEDLTVALSVSRQMKVIASSATAAYRKGATDLRQIGRDLGVRYLLEGNVRRVGDDLRVIAQLVEAEDGDIIWTRKFDRPLAELAALQEELVTEVAAHLGVEVQRAEMEHALRKPGDITAWEAVLRADLSASRQTLAGYQAAVAEARRAIAIDPTYDHAHATLAMALALLYFSTGSDNPELAQEALDAVGRARALDPSDPVVLALMAAGLHFIGKSREALPLAERAVSINPNLENVRLGLAAILLAMGRLDEAIAHSEAADRLAPNGIWLSASLHNQTEAHFRAERIEPALRLAEQSLRLRPNPLAHLGRIVCLAKLDRWAEAREAMGALCEENPQLSAAAIEGLVRNTFYRDVDAAELDEIVATIRKLQDGAPGERRPT
jgi:TolB-like protein/Flp pilus assembly protein TadD